MNIQSDREVADKVSEGLSVQEQAEADSLAANAKAGKRRRPKISEKLLYRLALIIPISGLVCVVLLSLTAWTPQPNAWKFVVNAFVVFILISGASFFSGGLVGFLFGFPRTPDLPENKSTVLKYQHNKNIEQISDWLIKMLIGIGLSQMYKFPGLIWYYASRLTEGVSTLGTIPKDDVYSSPAPASCLILFFLICGFIEGYLATRLLLPSKLVEVDKELV
jgi:hypothetical protein